MKASIDVAPSYHTLISPKCTNNQYQSTSKPIIDSGNYEQTSNCTLN